MFGPSVESIEPLALAERLRRGEDALVLIDVREADERAFCQITPSLSAVDHHFPMSSIIENVEPLLHATLDKVVVFYCHHGVRSRRVAGWFLAGCNRPDRVVGARQVLNLEGGIDRWSTEVDPEVPCY